MNKKNLKWRLGKLPSPEEVQSLVKDKIITNEEARSILFSEETEEDVDKDALKSEIKFLRELVDKLSTEKSKVVEIIKTIQVPYYHYGWVQPYQYWCGTTNLSTTDNYGTSGALTTSGITSVNSSGSLVSTLCNYNSQQLASSSNLSDINTF